MPELSRRFQLIGGAGGGIVGVLGVRARICHNIYHAEAGMMTILSYET